MGGGDVTAGPVVVDDADAVVLPFTVTIWLPRRRVQDGMSRLEPAGVVPANGWAGGRVAARDGGFSLANWLGISAARAQEIPPEDEEITRRGVGGRLLTPAEEFRLALYNAATRRLIELDPGNPELPGIATRDYVPDDAALARRQGALAEAERKARVAVPGGGGSAGTTEQPFGPETAATRAADLRAGRRPLDPTDIVAPDGKPVGERWRPGRGSPPDYVRTVSKSEFESLRAQLMALGYSRNPISKYDGEWYERSDGVGFGFRTDKRGLPTIDIGSPSLEKGF
jgi:hypothetical protein